MDLSDRIIAYITNHHPISYTKIVQVAQGKGFNEYQVTEALVKVHKSKLITTKTRKDEIWYDLVTEKPAYTPPPQPPYPNTNLMGLAIPFYSSVTDGPDEVYTLATRAFYKQKNEELKRTYDKEKEHNCKPQF